MKSYKGVVALPLVPIAMGILAWAGTKAIPAWWHHHITHPTKQQQAQAYDLCHNAEPKDCSVERAQAMQGLDPVVVGPPDYEKKETPVQIQGDQAVEGK